MQGILLHNGYQCLYTKHSLEFCKGSHILWMQQEGKECLNFHRFSGIFWIERQWVIVDTFIISFLSCHPTNGNCQQIIQYNQMIQNCRLFFLQKPYDLKKKNTNKSHQQKIFICTIYSILNISVELECNLFLDPHLQKKLLKPIPPQYILREQHLPLQQSQYAIQAPFPFKIKKDANEKRHIINTFQQKRLKMKSMAFFLGLTGMWIITQCCGHCRSWQGHTHPDQVRGHSNDHF